MKKADPHLQVLNTSKESNMDLTMYEMPFSLVMTTDVSVAEEVLRMALSYTLTI